MRFTDAIKSGFRNRTVFSGRSTRSEFWNWSLFVVLFTIVAMLCYLLDGLPATDTNIRNGFIIVCCAVALVVLPGIALTARRLHDLDRAGSWALIVLVPVIGQIVFIVWMFKRGTRGLNRFGGDPLQVPEIEVPITVA